MTEYLIGAAVVLSYYQVLSGRGLSNEVIGKFCYEVSAHRFDDSSWLSRWLTKTVGFGKRFWQYVAAYARKHPYEGGWACEIVEGEDFDWGIDMTRCGVCAFYAAEGAGEFTKWACPSDFPLARSLNVGMRRTTTLSEGAPRCDFRFKKGWKTQDDWPPRFAREPGRQAADDGKPP